MCFLIILISLAPSINPENNGRKSATAMCFLIILIILAPSINPENNGRKSATDCVAVQTT